MLLPTGRINFLCFIFWSCYFKCLFGFEFVFYLLRDIIGMKDAGAGTEKL